MGTTYLKYSKQIFAGHSYRPTLEHARAIGLGAVVEEGPLARESVRALDTRFGMQLPLATLPTPTIVDVNYFHGLMTCRGSHAVNAVPSASCHCVQCL